jgi:hypothetical protein
MFNLNWKTHCHETKQYGEAINFHAEFLDTFIWIITDWTIGFIGFDSRQGLGIFFFTTASRTALGPTKLPIQWVPGAIFPGIKRPGCESDHSPPSNAEFKE